jgi:O-Antigen ligase
MYASSARLSDTVRMGICVVVGGLLLAVIVSLGSPKLAVAAIAVPVALYVGLAHPRFVALTALPVFLLVPATLRLPTPSALPEFTPLRAVLLLAILGWILEPSTKRMPRRFVQVGAIFTIYVMFECLFQAPSAFSRGIGYSLEGLLTAWVVWRAIRDRKDALYFVDLLIAIGAFAALLALYEAVTGHFLIGADEPYFFHAPLREGAIRVQGIFPHPLVLGGAMVLLLPLAGVRAFTAKGSRKTLALGGGALMLIALLEAGGRGPWAGAIVAIIALAMLLRGDKRWTIVTVSVIAVIAIALSPAGGRAGALVEGVLNSNSGQEAGVYTVEYREKLLEASTDYAEHHLLGSGPGQAQYLHFYATVGGNESNIATSLDNAYAKYAVELGPIGLALFLWLLGTVMWITWRGRGSPDPVLSALAGGLLAGQAGLLIVSATVATFSWAQLATLFWALVGVSVFVYMSHESQLRRPDPVVEAVGHERRRQGFAVGR